MGEPQTLHFYDFGILGRVQTLHTQNQLFLFWESPCDLTKSRKIPGAFRKLFFEFKKLGNQNVDNVRKDGRRKSCPSLIIGNPSNTKK